MFNRNMAHRAPDGGRWMGWLLMAVIVAGVVLLLYSLFRGFGAASTDTPLYSPPTPSVERPVPAVPQPPGQAPAK